METTQKVLLEEIKHDIILLESLDDKFDIVAKINRWIKKKDQRCDGNKQDALCWIKSFASNKDNRELLRGIRAKELFAIYYDWCAQNEKNNISYKQFTEQMKVSKLFYQRNRLFGLIYFLDAE